MNNMIGGIVAATIAGLVGAAIWAAIAIYANIEIGWVAWGIGGLVGFAMVLGWRHGGPPAGVAAVVISIAAILGGKFASLKYAYIGVSDEIYLEEFVGTQDEFIGSLSVDNTVFIVSLAESDDDYAVLVTWLTDPDDLRSADELVSAEAWDQAVETWESMSLQEQAQTRVSFANVAFPRHRDAMLSNKTEFLKAGMDQALADGYFWDTFAILDIVFFGLAIITAFQIGSGGIGGDDDSEEPQMNAI